MTIYLIPQANSASLNVKLAKLNTRARKLGMDEITSKKVGETINRYRDDDTGVMCAAVFDNIEITGTTPVVDGYQFIAACDILKNDKNESQVVVRRVNSASDITIPSEYYHENTGHCDHCSTNRVRKYTYIIRNIEDGSFRQIGKSCMKDYFNEDIGQIVSLFESTIQVFVDLSDPDDDFYSTGGLVAHYDFESVLALTFASIREDGYRKSSELGSTRDYITSILTGRNTNTTKKLEVTDADTATAKRAIEWLNEQTINNDFLHNVKLLSDAGHFQAKYIGYVCGLAGFYQAADARRVKAEGENANLVNEYVGKIKGRGEMVLTLNSVKYTESYYGTTAIHNFTDDKGRSIVWFASNGSDMEKGTTYRVKATVKKHNEYNGIKQTQVARVTVIK
jgi:hypothetical protein